MNYMTVKGMLLHELYAWWYAAGVCQERYFSKTADSCFNTYLEPKRIRFKLTQRWLSQDWITCKEVFLESVKGRIG